MKTLSLLCSIIITLNVFSQLPKEQPLYPGGIVNNPVSHPNEESFVDSVVHPNSLTGLNRVYSFVSEPTYMIFPANKEKNKNIGLVIFPGGGLRNVWLDKEGTDIALWLSEQGITCMVVKYRTNRKNSNGKFEIDMGEYKPAVYNDAQTSMITMKKLADSLGFDKNKVGMMGFSAGGWLAERVVYKYYNGNYQWYPDFIALIYHGSLQKRIKNVKDPENLPPFFMAIAGNDYRLGVGRVMPYLSKVALVVPYSELHVYRDGGHGFGLAYDDNSSVSEWKNAFINWVDSLDN
jgi:acetyl esterase/lipase